MKVKYDREVDILYIKLNDSPIEESNEDRQDMVIDYYVDGLIVGIDIINASQHMT